MYKQGLELEKQAQGIIELESRAEVAEGERDAARYQMQAMTPRPGLPPGMLLPGLLGSEGTAKFVAALTKNRCRLLRSYADCQAPPLYRILQDFSRRQQRQQASCRHIKVPG